MRKVRVRNRTRDVCLARTAAVADSRWTRLRGLLGRRPLRPDEGLVLTPSRGIHMWGMRYSIDVVFTDDRDRVVALYRALQPWSRTRMHADAERAVELHEGTISRTGTCHGDLLEMTPVASGDGTDSRRRDH